MPELKTQCPHCGVRYWVEDRYVGVEAQCDDCGRSFKVRPANAGVISLTGLATAAGSEPRPPEEARRELVIPDPPISLLQVPANNFRRGSRNGYGSERPVHTVRLSRAFWISRYAVTQSVYEKVMRRNPSYHLGPQRPVDSVSWCEAQEFCQRLTERVKALGLLPPRHRFRLPTEAEWELACRAPATDANGSPSAAVSLDDADGEGQAFCFGDDPATLADYAWYDANSGGQTHAVGEKKPNAWGLYDMHGNVGEWCLDWFGPYSPDACADPLGPSKGDAKVRRGGSWGSIARRCRAADRIGLSPDCRSTMVGFRIALASN